MSAWKSNQRGGIPKDRFLLDQCLISMEKKTVWNVKSGFKEAGIIPIDRNQVLKRLLKKKPSACTAVNNTTSSFNENHLLLVNRFETFVE